MMYSMTGFGRSVVNVPNKKITIEVRSLNSKNLDLNVKLPSYYREKEIDIRDQVSKTLSRGKIEVSIYVEITGAVNAYAVNREIVKSYMEDLYALADEQTSKAELLGMAMRLPDSVQSGRDELDENEWMEIQKGITQALNACLDFRKQEGLSLEKDLGESIQAISDLSMKADSYAAEREELTRNRLKNALEQLESSDKADPDRFEQELIFYLEKYDINEEKVRLSNHLEYFQKTMKEGGACGKKLGFISQELGREINTMGSKANHAELQKTVVQMKDYLERIKEQILNVL